MKNMVEFILLGGFEFGSGEKVTIANVEEQGTETALAIVDDGGNILAYAVAANAGLSRNDLVSGDDLFTKIPEDKLDGFVGKVADTLSKGRIAVEVDLAQFQAKGNATSTPGRTTFTLKVAGSVRDASAKNAVIKAFRSGVKVVVKLKADEEVENGIAISYDGQLTDRRGNPANAGIIRPASLEEIEELQELVEAMGEVNGVVTETEDSSYTIQIAVENKIIDAVKAGEPVPDIEDAKERLIKEGIKTEEELDQLVEDFQRYGVETDAIIEVLETYKAYPADVSTLIPTRPTTIFIDENYFVNDVVAYVLEGSRKGIRLVGPKGTGKNLLEEWAAYLLQRPLYDQPITIDTDRYELLGSKTADVFIDENGNGTTKIVFDPENLIKAMEHGGIINLDEVNMASASVMALLNPVLDRRSYIDVSGYGRVVADSNFMVFATMNENYAGTQELNAATQDRFATLIFDANESIMSIFDSHEDTKDANQGDKDVANQLFEGMTRMIKNQDLSKDAETIRGFIAAVSIARRIGIRRALIQNVVNNINDEDTRDQVRGFIDTII